MFLGIMYRSFIPLKEYPFLTLFYPLFCCHPAQKTPYLNELLVSALLVIVSLPFGCWVIRSVPESMTEIEVPIQAEDIGYLEDEHVALPKGHEYGNEKDSNVLEKVVSV